MLPAIAYTKVLSVDKYLYINYQWWPWRVLEVVRTGLRQKKPYNLDTPYTFDEYKLVSGLTMPSAWHWNPMDSSSWQPALNKARADLVGKLGEASQFGATTTTELKATWGTVVTILTRMAVAARQVSRLEFLAAASTLGLPYKETVHRVRRKKSEFVSRRNGYGRIRVKRYVYYEYSTMSWGTGREYAKTLASGWLMWSYGVSPLMGDIQRGMKALTEELPSTRITAIGNATSSSRDSDASRVIVYDSKTRVKTRVNVRVANPNLWLANQMGLINPVQWINEGIPFSFVVDWFSNLSQIIMQMTDFAGLELTRPNTIVRGEIKESLMPLGGPYPPDAYVKQWTRVQRDQTIPVAKLLFSYERFQWQRGLNAISLILGFLPNKL